MSAFDICFASILHSEGGWSNNPRDNGGMTNLGVTKRAWEAWVGHPVTEQDMRSLVAPTVSPFYRAMYWNPIHGDGLPLALALCLFHCAVNAGPRRAAKLLQTTVGAVPDGAIGPATLAGVNGWVAVHGVAAIVADFQDALRNYYHSLHDFDVFGKGWLNRAADVEAQAVRLVA